MDVIQIKLWQDPEEDVTYIGQVSDSDCIAAIEFVAVNGDRIATVFSVLQGLVPFCERALRENGYDTSFANWDDEGRYLGLKRENQS